MPETTTQDLSVKGLLKSVRLSDELPEVRPMLQGSLDKIQEDVTDEERFLASMAALLYNIDEKERRLDKPMIQSLIARIDDIVADQVDEVLHAKEFKEMEATWASIQDLVQNTNFRANIELCLLDVSKEEAHEDLELNAADIAGSELFKKIYVAEYDQFGGAPYGGIIGMYDFANTPKDRLWLKTMGKIAAASHAPFIGAASPMLFGCSTMTEVNQLRDIDGLFNTPRYAEWNKLRDSEEAVYIGLTLPRYLVRAPYNDITNPAEGIRFEEAVRGDSTDDYLWGSSAMLFARNLVKSFETSGWCQYIRGVKGGGLVAGLPSYTYNIRGEEELRGPVETSMPDFREYELAKAGLIPLIHKKGTAEAVFYSAQSLKKTHTWKDPKDSENSQLVANLSYTFSVSRVAHYIKCIMRDNIGSSADAGYISSQIDRWISRFVTTVVNPDDLTLRYFPFKAYALQVNPVAGKIGWYHCNLSILPHIQFEGLDVDLRVDARLG
ncbi:type VI secretion system contractile sheath large subunit [Sorangium sp. So ce1097]|uniref:type VI secretion system contractile sheath large subunit n=1 Tax=Sorangium sp. So ce1097 TaxID=3133330 RepID=UPI003F61AC51